MRGLNVVTTEIIQTGTNECSTSTVMSQKKDLNPVCNARKIPECVSSLTAEPPKVTAILQICQAVIYVEQWFLWIVAVR